MRRFKEVQRSSTIPASLKIDLASDASLNDDQLEEAVGVLDPETPPGQVGFGFTEVLHSLMSREPNGVPVTDLSQYQQNLVDQGYAEANMVPSGEWDASWASASRRSERDAFDEYLSGNRPGSTAMDTAIRYLGATIPSGVWQGAVGSAKGIVEQSVETAGNLGLAGGLAAGAAIGGTIGAVGGPIGAGAGAIIGGAVGFIGGLFDDDEGEDNSNAFIDALSPWEEYSGEGGAAKFFDDLNYVVTATSLISGAGMAVKGVQGLAGISTAVKSGTPLRQALFQAPEGAKIGVMTRAFTGAKAPLVGAAAGGAIGGLTTGETEGALAGAGIGLGVGTFGKWGSQPIRDFVERKGLIAMTERPLLKGINETFTGVSAGQFGARISSDVLPGQQTIETAIEEQPLPKYATAIDLALFPLYPKQLLPFKGGKVAESLAASKLFRNQDYWAEDLAARTWRNAEGKTLDAAGRKNLILETYSPTRDVNDKVGQFITRQGFMVDGAREHRVMEDLLYRGLIPGSDEWRIALKEERATWNRMLNDPEKAVQAKSELLKDYTDAAHLNFIESLGTSGGRDLFTGLHHQVQAEDAIARLNTLADNGQLNIVFGRSKKSAPGSVMVRARQKMIDTPEATALKKESRELKKELDGLNPLAADVDPTVVQGRMQEIEARIEEIDNIFSAGSMKTKAPANITVANKAIPEEGILGTVTHEEVSETVTSIEDTMKQIGVARDNLNAGGDPIEIGKTLEELNNKLKNHALAMGTRELVSEKTYTKMLEAVRPVNAMSNNPLYKKAFGEAIASLNTGLKDGAWAHRIDNADELLAFHGIKLPETKTIVVTGEDVFRKDRFAQELRVSNEAMFTEDPNLWDSAIYWARDRLHGAGINFNKLDDQALFNIRARNVENSLQSELRAIERETGTKIDLQGRQLSKVLRQKMHEYNGEGAPFGPGRVTSEMVEGQKKVRYRMPLLDVRVLKESHVKDWGMLDDVLPVTLQGEVDVIASRLRGAIRRGGALGGEANITRDLLGSLYGKAVGRSDLVHPLDSLRGLSKELRLEGLPGYVDWARTWHIRNPRLFGAGAGAVVGGGIGAADEDAGFGDIAFGAAAGAILGVGASEAARVKRAAKIVDRSQSGMTLKEAMRLKWPEGSYGYLIDPLHRASMALRYTFSLAFDAGRHIENAMVATMKEGQEFTLKMSRTLKKTKETESLGILFTKGQRISGQEAFQESLELGNILRGRKDIDQADEFVARMFQSGVLGYSPIVEESARAWKMAEAHVRGGGKITKRYLEELSERARYLEGYGRGRRTAEKSVNFIFFPFSFQKKLVTTMGDFVTQAPTRALLIHEGFRRFQESGADERLSEWTDKWFPMAQQLKRLNNLSYGISPGRFLFQGLFEHDTNLGTVAQGLASAFVPSGSNTPIQQMFGGLGDSMVHMFAPTVISSDTGVQEAMDTMVDFVPAIRDFARFTGLDDPDGGSGLVGQVAAVTQGGAPYYQMQHYLDEKRAFKAELEPVATSLGYASVDGFLNSTQGAAIKPLVEQYNLALGDEYRKGQEMASKFENTAAINEQALYALANDPDRSDVEDVIVQLAQVQDAIPAIVEATGLPKDAVTALMMGEMRGLAAHYAQNRQFNEMWKRFFEYAFGPLTTIRTAA